MADLSTLNIALHSRRIGNLTLLPGALSCKKTSAPAIATLTNLCGRKPVKQGYHLLNAKRQGPNDPAIKVKWLKQILMDH